LFRKALSVDMKRLLWRLAVLLLAFALGVVLVRLVSPARVLVTWETASEVGTAGFFLYRSESPDGPFSLLDETLILAVGDPLIGGAYSQEDREVVWGRRYYYQLEEIEESGGRNRHVEVVEAQAGLGWPWALGAGVFLAVVAAVLFWSMSLLQRRDSRLKP
jgi:hypothetical protein